MVVPGAMQGAAIEVYSSWREATAPHRPLAYQAGNGRLPVHGTLSVIGRHLGQPARTFGHPDPHLPRSLEVKPDAAATSAGVHHHIPSLTPHKGPVTARASQSLLSERGHDGKYGRSFCQRQ